jgi:hypothetical protein
MRGGSAAYYCYGSCNIFGCLVAAMIKIDKENNDTYKIEASGSAENLVLELALLIEDIAKGTGLSTREVMALSQWSLDRRNELDGVKNDN